MSLIEQTLQINAERFEVFEFGQRAIFISEFGKERESCRAA
jgi:hypothetical protein